MTAFECRLCSATTSLISLFSGKSRKNRDIIRKLTLETVQIQFEEGDVHSCICYNCVVQVYNFYIFQVRTQENEQRLQEAVSSHSNPYRGKRIIIPLEVVPLPSIENLQETFTPWLQEKLQIITEEQVNTSSNSQNSSKLTTGVNVECQTELLVKDQGIQIVPSTEIKATQCGSILETKDMKIQVETRTKMRGTQCDLDSVTTKNIQLLADKDTQCNIITEPFSKSSGIFKHSRRKFAIDNNFGDKKLKSLVNVEDGKLQFLASTGLTSNNHNCNLFNGNNGEEEIQCKCGWQKVNIQLVNTSTQCDISKEYSIKVSSVSTQINTETDEIGLQTDSFSSLLVDESMQTDLSSLQLSTADFKNVLLNTKNELKKEMFSPLPSPARSLNISTEVSFKNESSAHIFDSPRTPKCFSPNLLQVTKKVNFVQVCRECDFLMYSKAEAKEHRKLHVKCRLCKKSFRSVKRMKEHFQTQCDAKLRTMIPKVTITRMDFSTVASHIEKNHQNCTTHRNIISKSRCLSPPEKKIKLK